MIDSPFQFYLPSSLMMMYWSIALFSFICPLLWYQGCTQLSVCRYIFKFCDAKDIRHDENMIYLAHLLWSVADSHLASQQRDSFDTNESFDSIPHYLLLAKLSAYGLDSIDCLLLENYFTDRFQRVKLSLVVNSPIGVILLWEYHKDQYWVLYCLTFILMTYFSLVCHPKSVHMLR